MGDEVVAALAHRVPEQDGALGEVQRVLAPALPPFPGPRGAGLQGLLVLLPGSLQRLREVLPGDSGARLVEAGDLGAQLLGTHELLALVTHGFLLPGIGIPYVHFSSIAKASAQSCGATKNCPELQVFWKINALFAWWDLPASAVGRLGLGQRFPVADL
jgi:hypothetical protein